MMAKAVNVRFPSGRELLGAYWGLLANGGLVLSDEQSLSEGDPVALEVLIESSQQRYQLSGQVVRRPARGGERIVIAFDPGEPHDLLLSAAWAETDNVPARRHRRFPVDTNVKLVGAGREHDGRLVNLSLGGCCVRVAGPNQPAVGDELRLVGAGGELAGLVRWAQSSDRGLEFKTDASSVEKFVKKIL